MDIALEKCLNKYFTINNEAEDLWRVIDRMFYFHFYLFFSYYKLKFSLKIYKLSPT